MSSSPCIQQADPRTISWPLHTVGTCALYSVTRCANLTFISLFTNYRCSLLPFPPVRDMRAVSESPGFFQWPEQWLDKHLRIRKWLRTQPGSQPGVHKNPSATINNYTASRSQVARPPWASASSSVWGNNNIYFNVFHKGATRECEVSARYSARFIIFNCSYYFYVFLKSSHDIIVFFTFYNCAQVMRNKECIFKSF